MSSGMRRGSTSTLLQSLFSRVVSKFRTPSCLSDTKPPLLHDNARSTENVDPQVQWLKRPTNGRPNRGCSESLLKSQYENCKKCKFTENNNNK